MSGSILIGCRGWDHDAWTPGFYPEDLPAEWRFCYYSNEIRGVLVPFGDISSADLHRCLEDCDDSFRFVFECPVDCSTEAGGAEVLRSLMERVQPVVDRTAAFLVSVPGDCECSTGDLRRLLEAASNVPLCVDLSDVTAKDPWRTALNRLQIGQVWHYPCVPTQPTNGFQISLVEDVDLSALRKLFEILSSHARGGAAVFFTNTSKAPSMASQARTLAEIMCV